MKSRLGFPGILMLIWITVVVVVFWGWGRNVVEVAHSNFSAPLTGVLVIRCIGIPVVPIGAIAGWFF
jgi:hypothetical protein